MNVYALGFCAFAALLGAYPAQAQVRVSVGNSKAYECYIAAKIGARPFQGVAACSDSLDYEDLSTADRSATYDNRGVMKAALQDTDGALADFDISIHLNAELGDAYVNRGAMLIRKERYDEALVDINKGLALEPSAPEIGYFNRAVAEELMGRAKDAYYDYKRVLEIAPTFTPASDRLKNFTVVRPGS